MHNTESIEEVKKTSDYAKFKVLNGNRPVKPAHLALLKESISEHGDLGIPVIVNEQFDIIDGQHRVKALEGLGLPIRYIMKKGFKINHVHVLNSNRKNWTMTEYMNCYAELGMVHYVRYKEFYMKYHFPQSITLAIVQGVYRGGQPVRGTVGTGPFKSGSFVFKDPEEAEDRAEKIIMLKDIYYGYKKSLFVMAMLRLFKLKDYNHTEFALKLKQQIIKLSIEPNNVNGYLRIFEDIYNYRRSGKKVSFFQELKIRN